MRLCERIHKIVTLKIFSHHYRKEKMARTESKMLPLGTQAPDFTLIDAVTNNAVSLKDVRGEKGTVVMFICNHCPFVKHVNDELVRICNDYRVTGFGFVGINSNDVIKYPEDSPAEMWRTARRHSLAG